MSVSIRVIFKTRSGEDYTAVLGTEAARALLAERYDEAVSLGGASTDIADMSDEQVARFLAPLVLTYVREGKSLLIDDYGSWVALDPGAVEAVRTEVEEDRSGDNGDAPTGPRLDLRFLDLPGNERSH
jgi:hypothetical protein